MLADVTNRARGIRGLISLDRGLVPLDPGASALLDLADHPLHRAWVEAGDIAVVPLGDKEARAVRRRLDAAAEARSAAVAASLAALPAAAAGRRTPPAA